ncbi:MAG TPA: hypothetical protein PLL77_04390 [Pyrinomonadaceae bacterium]|nr:hypothetical protein [Pyrinomonadaceae bacterium]
MADAKTRPLSPGQLQANLDSFAALKNIPNYNPANKDYEVADGEALQTAMDAAQVKSAQDEATAKASRDDEVAAQWAFHDFILGAKNQIKAQFGPNSNEIQALGLKKKSEYKSPSKKKPTP